MKIGVLTGGGDAQGLNPAIRAVVKYGERRYGYKFVGIKYGWGGLVPEAMNQDESVTLEKDEMVRLESRVFELNQDVVSGILDKGGTILGSSRANPIKAENGLDLLNERFLALKLDALIAVGGEDTLGVAYEAFKGARLPVVGIPKTIDNDICGTDTSIGFTTACEIVTQFIDRIHSTAESHRIIHVVEVMGRNAGWIALRSGMAAGADVILIPEFPVSIDEVCSIIQERRTRGRRFSIIVVAEGYPLLDDTHIEVERDPFGHERLADKRVGERLATLLKKRTGFAAKPSSPGHSQRGGAPATFDRFVATRLGIHAVDLIHNGQFGRMAAIVRNEIVDVELREVVSGNSLVPRDLFEELRWLFG